MLKGTQALMHAIETGQPEPTNEAQRKELSAEWQRTGDAATLAKLEAVEAQHTPGLLAIAQIVDEWESCTDYKIVRAKWGIPPDQNVYDFIRAARKAAIAKAGGGK